MGCCGSRPDSDSKRDRGNAPLRPVRARVAASHQCAVTVDRVQIPEQSKLFLWTAAAGWDPSVFENPNVFDLHRENAKRHLAFGKGIHFCIGSALGKLEARIALEMLTSQFPSLRLLPDQPLRFHPNISFRGPQALWVRAG